MQELITYQNTLLEQTEDKFFRYLYKDFDLNQKMTAIKGLRGAGKTTLLLQLMKYRINNTSQALYVTAEHPYFYNHSLFSLAEEFYRNNGKYFFIDEVHKYDKWSRELKLIYDGFPDLQIILTASSILDIFRGEADLSRRIISVDLPGMSFREYLDFIYNYQFEPVTLNKIISNHSDITGNIIKLLKKPLIYFKEYLKRGYLPFTAGESNETYLKKLFQVIDISLNTDLSYIEDYSSVHIAKIKKLLGVIAESAPFEPNISELARKLNIGRDTVNNFLNHLQKARILNLLNRNVKGSAVFKKPDKIYIENTNFSYALNSNPDIGTMRETFFLNQIYNSGYDINLPANTDFLIQKKYLFEIGGKNKKSVQLINGNNSFLVLDNIEIGHANKIPLWLFGFLY